MTDILVIGSLNMDMTLYVSRFPRTGETVTGNGLFFAPGGKGSNQALAAARLGADTGMVGCVGADANGEALIADLLCSGVEVSGIRRLTDATTGLAVITVCDGANMIVVEPGANNRMTAADIDALETRIAGAKALILQLEIPLDCVQRAMELAKKHGVTVFLNPAPYQPIPDSLYAADYLIPNETEAMALLGLDALENVESALHMLRERGARHPIITLGDRGAAYLEGDTFHLDPCCPVTAVDSTAAGDTFIGALARCILRGDTLSKAVAFAQRASAYCVSHKGAHTAIPTLEDVNSMDE